MCTECCHKTAKLNVGKHSHITSILYELHWVPIQARIRLKIILFTFKAVHNLALSYINSLKTIIKSKSSHCPRSNDGLQLEPPKGKMLMTFGARSFQASAL